MSAPLAGGSKNAIAACVATKFQRMRYVSVVCSPGVATSSRRKTEPTCLRSCSKPEILRDPHGLFLPDFLIPTIERSLKKACIFHNSHHIFQECGNRLISEFVNQALTLRLHVHNSGLAVVDVVVQQQQAFIQAQQIKILQFGSVLKKRRSFHKREKCGTVFEIVLLGLDR